MNISLDFDGTYTQDPSMWDNFIRMATSVGHKVHCVTMRYSNNAEATPVINHLQGKVTKIHFTGRKAKKKYMEDQGIHIDIWIDDQPQFLLHNAVGADKELA